LPLNTLVGVVGFVDGRQSSCYFPLCSHGRTIYTMESCVTVAVYSRTVSGAVFTRNIMVSSELMIAVFLFEQIAS